MQTEGFAGRFKGPLDCLMTTIRTVNIFPLAALIGGDLFVLTTSFSTLQEGWRALYKGATPPLLGSVSS